MPTPRQLEQFALAKGWSYRQLATAIRDQTGIDLHERSVGRYCNRVGSPSRRTKSAIGQFMAAQRQAEASR